MGRQLPLMICKMQFMIHQQSRSGQSTRNHLEGEVQTPSPGGTRGGKRPPPIRLKYTAISLSECGTAFSLTLSLPFHSLNFFSYCHLGGGGGWVIDWRREQKNGRKKYWLSQTETDNLCILWLVIFSSRVQLLCTA